MHPSNRHSSASDLEILKQLASTQDQVLSAHEEREFLATRKAFLKEDLSRSRRLARLGAFFGTVMGLCIGNAIAFGYAPELRDFSQLPSLQVLLGVIGPGVMGAALGAFLTPKFI